MIDVFIELPVDVYCERYKQNGRWETVETVLRMRDSLSVTKGFSIDPTIWNAMRQPEILEKLHLTVSAERIREEVMKMMKHDTPETIKILTDVNNHHIPGFIDLIFSRGLWLKPTFEK